MTNTPDRRDFWGNVHWHDLPDEDWGWSSRSSGIVVLPALAILGIDGVMTWALLHYAPLTWWTIGGVLALLLFAAYVLVKAWLEWLALDKPLDAYGRAQPGYESLSGLAPIVCFGRKFELAPSPPSGEAFNLQDIMNGAPRVGWISQLFTIGVVGAFILFAHFQFRSTTAGLWTLYGLAAAVVAFRCLWENWYMGGMATPGRIEVWHWWPGLTRTYSVEDSVLHVLVDSTTLQDDWWSRRRRRLRSWPQYACRLRQYDPDQMLAISVQVVKRGTGRPFTLARWCDPHSPYLARLLSLWVDLPIDNGMPFLGSQGGTGVFTPVHPEVANGSTGSSL